MARIERLESTVARAEWPFMVLVWELAYCALLDLAEGVRIVRRPEEYRTFFQVGTE